MADNNEQANSDTPPDPEAFAQAVQNQDWFLGILVDTVNVTGIALAITLFVKGVVITGHMIGGREYFALFGQEYETAFPGTMVGDKSAAEFYREVGEKRYPSEREPKQTPDAPGYIHLKNVRLFMNGQTVQLNSATWRGRLAEVDGFMFGEMMPTSVED